MCTETEQEARVLRLGRDQGRNERSILGAASKLMALTALHEP